HAHLHRRGAVSAHGAVADLAVEVVAPPPVSAIELPNAGIEAVRRRLGHAGLAGLGCRTAGQEAARAHVAGLAAGLTGSAARAAVPVGDAQASDLAGRRARAAQIAQPAARLAKACGRVAHAALTGRAGRAAGLSQAAAATAIGAPTPPRAPRAPGAPGAPRAPASAAAAASPTARGVELVKIILEQAARAQHNQRKNQAPHAKPPWFPKSEDATQRPHTKERPPAPGEPAQLRPSDPRTSTESPPPARPQHRGLPARSRQSACCSRHRGSRAPPDP